MNKLKKRRRRLLLLIIIIGLLIIAFVSGILISKIVLSKKITS